MKEKIMKLFSGKRAVMVLLAVAAVMMLPLGAQANIVLPLTLTVPNSDLSGYNGQTFGTVDVNLTGTSAQFTFEANPGFLFVDGGAFSLNLATPFTASTFTADNIFGNPITITNVPGEVSTFGNFNISYNTGNSGANPTNSGRFYSAMFTVTGLASGVTLDNLFAPNELGYIAAAHIGVIGTEGATGTLAVTGFAADGISGNTPPVPVPPSALLLGSGLLGLALVGWRRKKQ
jgi:hypothetical protein